MIQVDVIGFFDLHEQAVRFFGKSASILGFLTIFFASLYMTLRISYRTILSKVRESVPSLSSMKNAVLPEEEEDDTPPKKVKLDDTYKKKAEELEKKLANIQKAKIPEKEEKIPFRFYLPIRLKKKKTFCLKSKKEKRNSPEDRQSFFVPFYK